MGTNTSSDTVGAVGALSDAGTGTLDDASTPLEQRILAATIRCVGRWGVGKTTLDDIAREAGCSRATIYRVMPGGKDKLLMAAGEHELRAFFTELAARLDQTDSLAEVLTVALSEAVRAVQHHEVLQYLLAHEPEVVLRHVAFDALDPLLDVSAAFLEPYLRRYLDDPRIIRDTAEWVTRVAISYAFDPNEGLMLVDPGVAREFVASYFLPGIDAQLGTRLATTTDAALVGPTLGEVDLTTRSDLEPPTSSTEPEQRVGTSHKEYLPS